MIETITGKLEDSERCYAHDWQEGDFGIMDNLGLAHYASPDTQLPVEEAGLRILHRTTIAGTNRPTKTKSDWCSTF